METNKNILLTRLDQINWSPYLIKITLLLGLGLFFEYYDIFLAGYIAPLLLKDHIFNFATHGFMGLNDIAMFVACMFLGMWCGTLILGYVSDRYGRKSVFTWSLVWYSLCTFIMAFQTSKTGLDFWRFLASIGIGVEMVTITSYLSELIPGKYRGKATAIAMVVAFLSVPVVAFVSWSLSFGTYYGLDGFRIVIILGSVGAVFVWFIRRQLPESPRWLIAHGFIDQAHNVIKFLEYKTNSILAVNSRKTVSETPITKKGYSRIFTPPLLKMTIVLMVFHVFQTIGYYGFATWGPILLLAKGITITKTLEYSFIIAVANPVAPILYYFVADRLQRKMQIFYTSLAIAVFGVLFAVQTIPWLVIVFGVCLTLSINILSCSFLLYQAELYPTEIRSTAVGFVYSWSRFSAIFSSFIVAFIIKNYSVLALFIFIGSCMILVAVVVFAFGYKTNNLQLEKIT